MAYFDFGGVIVTAVAKTASFDCDFALTNEASFSIDTVLGAQLEFSTDISGNVDFVWGCAVVGFGGAFGGSIRVQNAGSTGSSFSGHIHYDIQYDEQKIIDGNLNLGGHAYPQAQFGYGAVVQTGYSVNVSISTNFLSGSQSQSVSGPEFNIDYRTIISISCTNFRFRQLDQFGQPVYFIVQSPSGPYAVQTWLSTGAGTCDLTGITYDAGPWSPIPYASAFPDNSNASIGPDYLGNPYPSTGNGQFSSGIGFVSAVAPDTPVRYFGPFLSDPSDEYHPFNAGSGVEVSIESAPSQSVAISGSILKGNNPSTDTIPCQYSPNSVNTFPYPIINAAGGVVATTITRYHSRYLIIVSGPGLYPVAIPTPPQDYLQGQPESLVIGGTYMPDRNLQDDSTCYRFDDTSWNVTTFAHAASVTVDSFTSSAGWSATNGTLAGSGVGIVVTSQPATLAKTSGYAKDFRNFRYVTLDLTTNMTGSVLALMLGTEIFRLPALMNGSNSIKIDLCSPQIINCPDDSRSNWEGFCGNIRGVALFDNIQLTGFAVGERVTLNSLTLTRTTAKGLCIPEDEPWNPTSYLEWYNPSIYVPQSSNGFAGTPGSTVIRASVLRDRADGKPAADIHCAISTAAAAQAQVISSGFASVGSGDRINVTDFITAVNAQVGISCTAGATLTGIVNIQSPGDGLGPNPYSPNIPAAFLTLDSGASPGSIDADMTSVALNCQPFYATCTRFIGQQTAGTYNFIKRLGGAVQGLVISPGGPLAGINVLMTSPDSQPPQNLTTDADGYYRSAAQWPAFVGTIDTQVTLATNTCTGQVYIRTRAWRFLGLGGAGIGGCNDLLNCQFGFYVIYINALGNLICSSAPHANMPLMDVGVIDTSNDCSEPHICQQEWTGLLSCVYTRGKGTLANPYRIYRAISLDFGVSWKQLGMISF